MTAREWREWAVLVVLAAIALCIMAVAALSLVSDPASANDPTRCNVDRRVCDVDSNGGIDVIDLFIVARHAGPVTTPVPTPTFDPTSPLRLRMNVDAFDRCEGTIHIDHSEAVAVTLLLSGTTYHGQGPGTSLINQAIPLPFTEQVEASDGTVTIVAGPFGCGP